MFESIALLWKEYCKTHQWAANDPRMSLAAEVANRLDQLDRLLEYLQGALAKVRPAGMANEAALLLGAAERYRNGEITDAEYEAAIRAIAGPTPPDYLKSWSDVRLFTEAFYLFAWRLREILDARGPCAFSDLGGLEASGIRVVRNTLLQHPQDGGPVANYAQSLMVTDDGPVLKTSSFLAKGGRTSADHDSLDRGLFRNAEDLRAELDRKLRRALARTE